MTAIDGGQHRVAAVIDEVSLALHAQSAASRTVSGVSSALLAWSVRTIASPPRLRTRRANSTSWPARSSGLGRFGRREHGTGTSQTGRGFFLGGFVSLATMTNPLSKIPLFFSLASGLDETHAR